MLCGGSLSVYSIKIKKLRALPRKHFFLGDSQPRLAKKLLCLGTKESMSRSKWLFDSSSFKLINDGYICNHRFKTNCKSNFGNSILNKRNGKKS